MYRFWMMILIYFYISLLNIYDSSLFFPGTVNSTILSSPSCITKHFYPRVLSLTQGLPTVFSSCYLSLLLFSHTVGSALVNRKLILVYSLDPLIFQLISLEFWFCFLFFFSFLQQLTVAYVEHVCFYCMVI